MLPACGAAFRHGWKQVKLYFMMGLPTETDEDIIGIARLAKKVVDLYTEIRGRRGCKVTVSVSCFVPKPYTPFQWFGQLSIEEFQRAVEPAIVAARNEFLTEDTISATFDMPLEVTHDRGRYTARGRRTAHGKRVAEARG